MKYVIVLETGGGEKRVPEWITCSSVHWQNPKLKSLNSVSGICF